MKGILEDANRSLVSFNSVMIEYVSGMRLIKAYNMGSRSFQKFSHAISEENRIWNLVTHKTAPPYAAFLLLVECGMLLMIPAGGLMFLSLIHIWCRRRTAPRPSAGTAPGKR